MINKVPHLRLTIFLILELKLRIPLMVRHLLTLRVGTYGVRFANRQSVLNILLTLPI